MRKILFVLLLPVMVSLGTHPAFAAKRIALVIGNSAYENISALDNPKNDAELMRRTLIGVGFEVIVATDADYNAMRRAIRDFSRELHTAGKDAVGLFYYAGHGVQSKGTNFLIPIGAEISNPADLSLEAVTTADVLDQMEGAGNALNLVILDSCRNNPFKGVVRSGTRGLTRISAASGTLVAFSAAPGQTAVDGRGKNSPYTEALARFIKTPNIPVEQVFKRVRNSVEAETSGQQTPWEESSLRGDFYFMGKPANISSDRQAVPDDSTFELSFWESIKSSTNAQDFTAYLETYPQGRFARLAKVRLEQFKDKQVAAVTTVPTQKIAEPLKQVPPIHECDRLAAYRGDPDHVGDGVKWSALSVASALEACRQAVAVYPGVARFEYQLGRVLTGNSEYEEALRWYHEAAEKGYSAAMADIGTLYNSGDGVSRDVAESLRWYRKAADIGHADAMRNIGLRYSNGEGVTKDHAEALRWFRKAAEKNLPSAYFSIAISYYNGYGVDRSFQEAANLMFRALRLGSEDGLDLMIENSHKGSLEFRRALQEKLREHGFYDGPIDGDFGPATKRAIRKLSGDS